MKNDVSKKRKKTSREKRVLVASLGIAAVVAAGSTFAWFTSQDEVTNRLSANAAYDVSVIETFTPPTNWTPGQRVNKDTAAVNTGNIPAFVKQKLSGRMQVTMESAVQGWDTLKNTYVELTEDEVDIVEAGGFLAYAFDTVIDPATGNSTTTKIGMEKGEVINDETQCYLGEISAVHSGLNYDLFDPDNPEAKENENFFGSDKQFVPPATGDYIFRRVIDVIQNDDGTTTEKYEYKGYHFDKPSGKYYKIKVLNGLQTGENGILKDAPVVYYAAEKHEVQDLPLRFEAHAEKHYLLFNPTNISSTTHKQYLERIENVKNRYGDIFTVYTVDNGTGVFDLDYYLCTTASGNSNAKEGTIYLDTQPVGRPIGDVSGDPKQYDISEKTPDRLVATYVVGKADDVFIDGSTDLSDFTAKNYDERMKAIAKSDYLIAEANYLNAKAEYELDKKAYDASVALLEAIKKNEKALSDKKSAINSKMSGFNASLESALVFEGDAATSPYVSGAGSVNDALTTVTEGNTTYVKTFKSKIEAYHANPNDVTWKEVLDAYKIVVRSFDNANDAIIKLEETIVRKWNEAAIDQGMDGVATMAQINQFSVPANASPDTLAVKAAANQLKTWESKLTKYQKAISEYYGSLSNVQSDAQYKLVDLSSFANAYKEAVKATAPKYVTNEAKDPSGNQTGLATTKTPLIDAENCINVDDKYKIRVDGTEVPKKEVNINSGNTIPKPIKYALSEDGYASVAIDGITGDAKFLINGIAIDSEDAIIANKPSDEKVLIAAGKYEEAKKKFDEWNTKHTNQEVNNDIVIYINLKNIYDSNIEKDDTLTAEQKEEALRNKWKLTPTLVPGGGNGYVDGEGNEAKEAKEANFYYSSILGGGETSSILVDSVELSKDVKAGAYKEFDFDLNVTVDSAQVVVSEDGRFYESTAVNANPEFYAKPSEPHYKKEPAKQSVKDNTLVNWN